MRTLVATVSIGERRHLTRHSLPRMERWAATHGLDFAVVREPLVPAHLPPHFNKLAVPQAHPGYDRYVIVDDDLLVARHAPEPPRVPSGCIGLAPDDEQRNTTASYVEWTGNTGFIVADGAAGDLFAAALAHGAEPAIWGYADQGALNHAAWTARRIVQLDPRWNHMPVIRYFVRRDAWEAWRTQRFYRLRFYAGLCLPFSPERRDIRAAYGVHLVRAPYPGFFSRLMG